MSFELVNRNCLKSKRCFAKDNTVKNRRTYDDLWYGDTSSIDSYIKCKIKMLKKDMKITPTQKEIDHLYDLTNTVAIDNAVHSIIDRHWASF